MAPVFLLSLKDLRKTYRGDFINAGHGQDIAFGSSGNDVLYGGDGDDTLYGGAGDDWMRV